MDWSFEGVANTWENDGSIGSWSKPKRRFDVEEIGVWVTEVGIWWYLKLFEATDTWIWGFERPGRNSFCHPELGIPMGFTNPKMGDFTIKKYRFPMPTTGYERDVSTKVGWMFRSSKNDGIIGNDYILKRKNLLGSRCFKHFCWHLTKQKRWWPPLTVIYLLHTILIDQYMFECIYLLVI